MLDGSRRVALVGGRLRRFWPQILLVAIAFALGIGFRQLVASLDFSQHREFAVHDVTVTVQTAAEIAATRDKLIRYIFGTTVLPTALPTDNGDGTYTVHMANGFNSIVRVLRPDSSNRRLMLYHTGHTAYGKEDQLAVDGFVSNGYTVLLFDMPLIGVNAAPVTVQLPEVGATTISIHDEMPYLDPITDGSPIRYFLEPVVVMLNKFAGEFDDISMAGLSGGGWTTTMAAAIDTRIDRSYPVAGTVPLVVRFARDDSWGDWEQIEPSLYAIADYPDLYVLGAYERRQMQVLNEFDPCCFSGDHRSLYEPQVKAALRSAGAGTFDVFLDRANRQHSVSRAALSVIFTDIDITPPAG